MIIWGSGGDVINLGVLDTRRCDTCERDRPFNISLQYRYWALYWIFSFVTSKQYLLACDVCSRGWQIDASKIEPHLKGIPIPFMRRYGLLTFIGGIVALFLIASLS